MGACNGKHQGEKLLAALASAAERRLSEFNVQELANTAWALATAIHRDEKLLAPLAKAAERCLSDFKPLANTAWAFATA